MTEVSNYPGGPDTIVQPENGLTHPNDATPVAQEIARGAAIADYVGYTTDARGDPTITGGQRALKVGQVTRATVASAATLTLPEAGVVAVTGTTTVTAITATGNSGRVVVLEVAAAAQFTDNGSTLNLGGSNFVGPGQLSLEGDGTHWKLVARSDGALTTQVQTIAAGSLAVGTSTASAATLTLPNDGAIIPITGTTTVTAIATAGETGRVVYLQVTGACQFTDNNGTLDLNGDFLGPGILTLQCDGTHWLEVARSTALTTIPSVLTANARVGVRKNSTGSTYLRRRLNLIEGSNVTLTVADDGTDEEVDITIAASGGGSPAPFPRVEVYRSSAQSINDSTLTILTFNTEILDSDGFHDNSTNSSRLTVPTGLGGRYRIWFCVNWASNSTGRREAWLFKNSNGVPGDLELVGAPVIMPALSGIETYCSGTWEAELQDGDYVEVHGKQTSGGALNASPTFFGEIAGLGMERIGELTP